jgi:hypothetical protein
MDTYRHTWTHRQRKTQEVMIYFYPTNFPNNSIKKGKIIKNGNMHATKEQPDFWRKFINILVAIKLSINFKKN